MTIVCVRNFQPVEMLWGMSVKIQNSSGPFFREIHSPVEAVARRASDCPPTEIAQIRLGRAGRRAFRRALVYAAAWRKNGERRRVPFLRHGFLFGSLELAVLPAELGVSSPLNFRSFFSSPENLTHKR